MAKWHKYPLTFEDLEVRKKNVKYLNTFYIDNMSKWSYFVYVEFNKACY